MASDAAVVYEIQADNRPLRQDLDETTQAIERESKKWDRTVEESAGSMEKAFAKALDINRIKDYAIELGKALVQFGKEAIEAASDLREVQNVVDVTFGEAASSINDWAKAAGTQFGLTETQAKRFASTLGAMAKSSGIADKDIMQMSTDLAGLAADMASFYNLDFDTAFEKIRSGLSGATEPLKSLGINMSVANLEAYALSQGLSKTFSNMTQGEQIMLRYQYLMQATADAQGDFARTSDGFANASRRLQTALDTIKTRVGDLLMTVVEPATAGLADFLSALTAEPQTTVLDKFNSIDLDTTTKLAEIEQVKGEALILIETLEQINGQAMAKEGLSTFVASLAEDFGELDGAIAAAKSGDYAGTLSEVAKALELETGASADTWKTLLQAIANNLPAVTDVTGSDTSTSAFLKAAADAAAELGGEYPELWDELLTTLGEKAGIALSGLAEYAAGTQAMSEIADAAGKLKGDEQGKWEGLLSAIQDASGITNLFGNADSAAKNIKELAGALGSSEVSDEKASAWQTLLATLAQNADGLSALTGDTAEGTKEWLEGLAEGAKALTADDAEAWNALFGTLLEGLPGLSETDEGKTFLEQLGKGFEAIGESGAEAIASLAEDFGELDGAIAAAKSGDYAGTLSEVAKALELETGASADTWKTLLQAIANNLPAVTDATGSDTSTSAFLKAAADAAAELGGEYPELWDELLTTLGEKAGIALSGLAEYAAGTQAMSEIADAAGKLKGDEQGKWEGLLSAIQDASGITNLFGNADSAAKNIKELAGALGSSEVSDEKASAWQTLLSTLAQNADGLSALTGDTAEGTKEWLEGLAEGAKALTADDAEAWNTLFGTLLEGLPGLSETDEGKTFLEQLGKGFEAIGESGAEAIASLSGLGSETGGIADRQKQWLAVCKQLVQTIPGLSTIINTETGEITGGTEAVIRYVDEWEKAQRKLTALKAVQAKRDALADSYGDLVSLELDTMVAEQRAKAVQDKIQAIQDKYEGLNWEGLGPNLFQMIGAGVSLGDLNALGKLQTEYSDLSNAVDRSRKSYENAKKAYDEASSVIDEYAAAAEAMEGDVESLTDANNALTVSETEASNAISAAKDALTELQEYTDNARSNVETAVNQLVSGFSKIDTPVEEANKKIQELQDQLNSLDTSKDAAEIKKLNDQINSLGADRPSMQNMTAGLQDQLKYMQEYGDLLDSINSRDLKIDENLLAELADGSADSMDYLRVLASASDDEITKLNEAYQKVQSQKTTFTDQLTAQKLAADEAYDAIVQKANEAVSALDLSSESSDAMSNTVEGMANGIAAALPSLQAQVDAVLDVLSQLEGFSSIGLSLGEGGEFTFTLDGEHANGLDYVPFDNYLAALHEGESILTAEEARVWRRFKDGGAAISNTIDYDAIGGVIRDNSGSGNVYLEGRAVGRIINGNQADQYRSLQRSGWTG